MTFFEDSKFVSGCTKQIVYAGRIIQNISVFFDLCKLLFQQTNKRRLHNTCIILFYIALPYFLSSCATTIRPKYLDINQSSVTRMSHTCCLCQILPTIQIYFRVRKLAFCICS